MDERRKRLLGTTDDADARGEHRYPDAPPADAAADDSLSRQADAYVAGADGTQSVTATPDAASCLQRGRSG
jgi:hypothetical protein